MKKILARIYSYIKNIQILYIWNRQAKALRKINRCKEYERLVPDGKYMLLLPHADDEWIGASSIIKNIEYDVVLCNMDMPGGDSSEMHIIRENEFALLGRTYGRKILKAKDDIRNIIIQEKPKYIMLPFFVDWHQEHLRVMNILFDYLQNENESSLEIVMYQVSVPIQEKFINRVNPLSKADYDEKWNVFKRIYKSQIKIPYHRFGCNDQITGALVKSYAAEAYVEMDAKCWVQYYKKFILNGKDYSPLKQYINDLQKVRENVKSLTQRGVE